MSYEIFNMSESTLPFNWRLLSLKDLSIEMFGGGTPSTKRAEFWEGDQPWTTSAMIGNDDIYLKKYQRLITREALDNSSTKVVPKGSIIIGTRVGVGKAVVTLINIAINQDLTAFIPTDEVSPEFLVLSIKQKSIQQWFNNNKRGATIKGIPRNDLANIRLFIPPLPEQKAIAHILQAVQEAKEKTEEVIRVTKQLKESIMKHLFTYGPVPPGEAEKVKLKETEIGIMPEEWEVKPLIEIATLQRGKDLPRQKQISGIYPVVGSGGIIGWHNEYICKGPGVVTGRSGSIGSLTFIEREYWPHNTGLYVKDFHKNDPKFIFYLLHLLNFKKYATGVSVPTLNRNFIHHILLPLPSLSIQKK